MKNKLLLLITTMIIFLGIPLVQTEVYANEIPVNFFIKIVDDEVIINQIQQSANIENGKYIYKNSEENIDLRKMFNEFETVVNKLDLMYLANDEKYIFKEEIKLYNHSKIGKSDYIKLTFLADKKEEDYDLTVNAELSSNADKFINAPIMSADNDLIFKIDMDKGLKKQREYVKKELLKINHTDYEFIKEDEFNQLLDKELQQVEKGYRLANIDLFKHQLENINDTNEIIILNEETIKQVIQEIQNIDNQKFNQIDTAEFDGLINDYVKELELKRELPNFELLNAEQLINEYLNDLTNYQEEIIEEKARKLKEEEEIAKQKREELLKNIQIGFLIVLIIATPATILWGLGKYYKNDDVEVEDNINSSHISNEMLIRLHEETGIDIETLKKELK